MSSFWSTSTGENAADNAASNFEVEGGGSLEPMPEGTSVLAFPKKAEWSKTQDGNAEFVNIQWSVMKPEQFANRVIFHKLWVADLDPNVEDLEKAKKKRDRNLNMFASIDFNATGKINPDGSKTPGRLALLGRKPTNEDLAAALTGKTMVIGLGIWETNDGKSGNWVRSVSDKSAELKVGTAKPVQKANKPSSGSSSFSRDLDDEIPF